MPGSFDEIVRDYPGLVVKQGPDGSITVQGELSFSANYANKGVIEDSFGVNVFFPPAESSTLPTTQETSGRVKNFHVNQDGTLCLAALPEIRRRRKQDPSLRAYIEGLVIPFFYSFSYQERHSELPFGDLPHGGQGTMEYYRELFGVDSDLAVLQFLKILTMGNYKGHIDCPCDNGAKIRNCHGAKLIEIRNYQNRVDFLQDFAYCCDAFKKTGQRVSRGFFNKSIGRFWDKNISKIIKS